MNHPTFYPRHFFLLLKVFLCIKQCAFLLTLMLVLFSHTFSFTVLCSHDVLEHISDEQRMFGMSGYSDNVSVFSVDLHSLYD